MLRHLVGVDVLGSAPAGRRRMFADSQQNYHATGSSSCSQLPCKISSVGETAGLTASVRHKGGRRVAVNPVVTGETEAADQVQVVD